MACKGLTSDARQLAGHEVSTSCPLAILSTAITRPTTVGRPSVLSLALGKGTLH